MIIMYEKGFSHFGCKCTIYLKIKKFRCLGIEINNFQICTYDFAVSGITPEFDGMLGIDFFQNNKICIDFIKSELTIS